MNEQDWCRLCRQVGGLSVEHIPPRGAFNKGRGRQYRLDDWLKRESLDELGGGIPFQGGSKAPTLCGDCNNFCGVNYAKEYVVWARVLSGMLRKELGEEPDLPEGGFLKFQAKCQVSRQIRAPSLGDVPLPGTGQAISPGSSPAGQCGAES